MAQRLDLRQVDELQGRRSDQDEVKPATARGLMQQLAGARGFEHVPLGVEMAHRQGQAFPPQAACIHDGDRAVCVCRGYHWFDAS